MVPRETANASERARERDRDIRRYMYMSVTLELDIRERLRREYRSSPPIVGEFRKAERVRGTESEIKTAEMIVVYRYIREAMRT